MTYPAWLHRPLGTCVLAGYLLGTTGCQSWHTRQGDVATVIAPAPEYSPGSGPGNVAGLTPVQPATTSKPDTVRHVRVTTVDGATMELYDPRVANDSLYGRVQKKKGPEAAFALADVKEVKTQGFNALGTVGLVVGMTAAVVAVSAVAAMSMCDATWGDC